MNEQIAIQSLLNEKMTEARLRNPSYSLRAFAKKAGLSPSALSEILKGKRKISPKLFVKISENLALSPEEINKVRSLFQQSIPDAFSDTPVKGSLLNKVQISADQYSLVADWYHFAILSLMQTKDFHSDSSWIALRLGISKVTVEAAIERMIRLGYIGKENDQWILTTGYLKTTDEVANLSLRRANGEDLHLAQKALQEVALELRDFTATTMAIDPKNIKEAKLLIRDFRKKLTAMMIEGDRTEVYKMCIQLFPLSKGGSA